MTARLTINGWHIFGHPLFLDQLEALITAVEKERTRRPVDWQKSANAKLLTQLRKLAFDVIPQDPTRQDYRLGGTLGKEHKHWFRAKFGNGRFRLFFRYSSKTKIIVFAWVNDEQTLRTYGSKTDAYTVFQKMLDKGNPPNDWTALYEASNKEEAQARLSAAIPSTPGITNET